MAWLDSEVQKEKVVISQTLLVSWLVLLSQAQMSLRHADVKEPGFKGNSGSQEVFRLKEGT